MKPCQPFPKMRVTCFKPICCCCKEEKPCYDEPKPEKPCHCEEEPKCDKICCYEEPKPEKKPCPPKKPCPEPLIYIDGDVNIKTEICINAFFIKDDDWIDDKDANVEL